MWLQYIDIMQQNGKLCSIPISSFLFDKKTSYIYVKDISRIIASLLLQKNVKNEIFNIGI